MATLTPIPLSSFRARGRGLFIATTLSIAGLGRLLSTQLAVPREAGRGNSIVSYYVSSSVSFSCFKIFFIACRLLHFSIVDLSPK